MTEFGAFERGNIRGIHPVRAVPLENCPGGEYGGGGCFCKKKRIWGGGGSKTLYLGRGGVRWTLQIRGRGVEIFENPGAFGLNFREGVSPLGIFNGTTLRSC